MLEKVVVGAFTLLSVVSVSNLARAESPSEPQSERESEPQSSGFYLHTATGIGGGFFHYLSGGGAGNLTEVNAFSFHASVFAGGHFGPFGIAVGAHLQPLVSDRGGVAPGGFGGALFALRPTNRLQIDLMTGFGGMGVSKVFGGIGPAWAPGLSYDVVKQGHARVTVGLRVVLHYTWEPDNARADPAFFVAPSATVGFTYW